MTYQFTFASLIPAPRMRKTKMQKESDGTGDDLTTSHLGRNC